MKIDCIMSLVSLLDDQNVLEQDKGNGCTTFMNILNATEL